MHPNWLRSPVVYTLRTGDVQLARQGQLQQLLKCRCPKTAGGSELNTVYKRVLSQQQSGSAVLLCIALFRIYRRVGQRVTASTALPHA